MKGQGLIFVGFDLFIVFYLFHGPIWLLRSITIEWDTAPRVARRLLRLRDGPIDITTAIVQVDGIVLALTGLVEVLWPGSLAQWFGFNYAMLGLVIVLGIPFGWIALALWQFRHRRS